MKDPSTIEREASENTLKIRGFSSHFLQLPCILSKMVHAFSIVFAGIICWTAVPGSSLFSWHPTMMTIGFGILMFEAILMFSRHSSLVSSESRKTKAEYHWMLQLFALVFTISGAAVIIYNKELHGKPHLTTWHGTFGIITLGYAILQSVAGISLFYPKLKLLNPAGWALRILKQLHALSGAILFNLACATIFLGFFSTWFLSKTNTVVWYICTGLLAMLASIITNQVADVYVVKK